MDRFLQRAPILLRLTVACLVGTAGFAPPGRAAEVTSHLTLPPGFSISVFAKAPGARTLVLARQLGVMFVSTRFDTVYAIPLRDDDDAYPTYPVLRGLKSPNGIAWKDGYLYIAEQHRLTRYHVPSIDALPSATPEVLSTALPDKEWHGNRYAIFGTDGALYVGVGSPCNICAPQGLEGSITRFAGPDWKPERVATGIRNSVGLDVQPATGDIYFTDNGADGMGDDSPPEELNRLQVGGHYGFPWFGGGDHRTPQFRTTALPDGLIGPVMGFQAHAAGLGVDFYDGRMFPAEYRGDAFIAQHGSWNRSSRVGYRILRVTFKNGKAVGKAPFIEGWLRPNQAVTGRPVDLEELPDGSLLISDDNAGVIYRVTYKKP